MFISLPEGVCDVHIHVGSLPQLKVSFSLEDLVKIMDKWRIGKALVFSSYVDPERETKQILKTIVTNRRLYGLVRVKPSNYQTSKFLKWLERLLVENPRIIGVKINPSTEKHRVTEDLYRPCLEMLSDHEGVLLLHCGRWVEMSGWHYGVEVAKRYPRLKVILAHLGGTHPDLAFAAITASKDIKNIYMDTSQTRQINVIRTAIETLGPSRILFGSDMPWGDYVQNLVGLVQLNLSESVIEKVLRENFGRIVEGRRI